MDLTPQDLDKIAQHRAAELQEEVLTLRRLLVAVDAFFKFNPKIEKEFHDLASAVSTAATGSDISGPVIDAYSRRDALKDGALVDVTSQAKAAGIKLNTALTRLLFEELQPTPEEKAIGQSFQGRIWDMFNVFRFKVKNSKSSDVIEFTFSVACTDKTVEVPVKGICGPGDDRRPVMTFMLSEED